MIYIFTIPEASINTKYNYNLMYVNIIWKITDLCFLDE